MRKEYDFAAGRKNLHAARMKKQITIRLDQEAIAYFKAVSSEVGIPYQSLINLYLRDCPTTRRKPRLDWRASGSAPWVPSRCLLPSLRQRPTAFTGAAWRRNASASGPGTSRRASAPSASP